MFIVAVRHWGDTSFSSFFGPFESHEEANEFREKMSQKHSRRDAEVHEISEPF